MNGSADQPSVGNRIVVVVEGGMVQNVLDIPSGYCLEVHDYDVEGSGERDLETDDDGDVFFRGVWQASDSAGTSLAVSGKLLQLCEDARSICDEAATWLSGDEAYDIEVIIDSLETMARELEAAIAEIHAGSA